VANYLAALRLCNLDVILKSIIWLFPASYSSSIKFSLDYIALYIIELTFKSSFTASPVASYSFFGFKTILAFEANS
jgi:hypothetical protein